ncbi:hypothetical protein CRG98_037452, partial [Punica granatum]
MAQNNQPASSEENTPPTPVYYQPPMTHALPPPTPAGALPAHSGEIPPLVPTPEAQASSPTEGAARIVALECDITALKGTVNQMAADMAELMALLRASNRTSSNSTPPPGHSSSTVRPGHACTTANFHTGPDSYLRGSSADGLPGTEPPQFVIHTFQDSLAGAALDWYMSLKAADILTWADLSSKFIDQYRYCAETPPTLLELSTMGMTDDQGFEAYAVKWWARAAKHVPPINEAQQIQLFHSTLKGACYLHLLAHTYSFSNFIDAGKKLDIGVKLGKIEGPAEKKEGESSKKAATGTPSAGNRRGRDASVNAVNSGRMPHLRCITNNNSQRSKFTIPRRLPFRRRSRSNTLIIMPLLLLRFNKVGPRLQELLSRCNGLRPRRTNRASRHKRGGEYETGQEAPAPFVIEYVPAETGVGYAGFDATPAPFVIEVPAREPYLDSKVPWTYEGSVGNLERQFNVMGVTRSGRIYENLEAANKGKAPAAALGIALEATSIPQKKVTEEETEAFMKIIKASEYKVVEQMGKSPAHISLLALLLSSEPHCEALLKVLTVAQVFDIPNAFSLLLGRPWIHSAGADPSTLHQKLKFIVEERLITVKGEEDYAIYKETAVPYISIGDDQNLPFYSFDTISVIRDYGKIIEARRGKHLHRLAAHYGKINRGIPIPPLSHFFPAPPHIVGGTLDDPFSGSDAEPVDLSAICAVTEEIPFGVYGQPNQRAMVTLFHDMMHKEIEVYVDDMIANPSSMRNIAKWRCQLTEYDIKYVPRTSVKGQAIADHLAEFPIEDDTPINSDFPDEGILQVDEDEDKLAWKMYFDGTVNSTGSGIGAVLISPDRRRLAAHYFLSGETLYRRSFDATLLRCVDGNEAQRLMGEIHEGSCGPYMSGLMLTKKLMRLGYFWSTMEADCAKHIKHCHLCQVYVDQIKAPPNELRPMAAPWPFSMWGIDWIDAITLTSVTANAVARFLKRDIIARYGVPETIITDNAKNLNNRIIDKLCERFKIHHRNSTPYRPQMNGAVEAANKNIERIIEKMT